MLEKKGMDSRWGAEAVKQQTESLQESTTKGVETELKQKSQRKSLQDSKRWSINSVVMEWRNQMRAKKQTIHPEAQLKMLRTTTGAERKNEVHTRLGDPVGVVKRDNLMMLI